jgi:predicted nuclease of predicted toxin-antitoxin system
MLLKKYTYWIDANLPPKTTEWLGIAFGVQARHVFNLQFLTAEDAEIFEHAKKSTEHIIIITKDEDFIDLVLRKKPPPKVIWITAGNLSNTELKKLLLENIETAVEQLQNSEYFFIEIS